MDHRLLKTLDCYIMLVRTSVASPDTYMPLLRWSGALDHTYGISYIVAWHSSSHASLWRPRSFCIHLECLRFITLNSCFRYFDNPFTSTALSILEPVKPGAGLSAAAGLGLTLSALEAWRTGLCLVGVVVLLPLVEVVLWRWFVGTQWTCIIETQIPCSVPFCSYHCQRIVTGRVCCTQEASANAPSTFAGELCPHRQLQANFQAKMVLGFPSLLLWRHF